MMSLTTPTTAPFDSGLKPLGCRYLLLTFIPCHVDEAGQIWLDRLWHRDLVEHLHYLPRFTLVAPRAAMSKGHDLVRLDVPTNVEFSWVELPRQDSLLGAMANLPATAWTLWRAIGAVDVVHSGIVGWPYPLGWLANPIALVRGKRLVLVIESAPWRQSLAGAARWHRRLISRLTEWFGRAFVRRADVSFFTHPSYRQSLAAGARGPALVVPATWIHPDDILSDAAAAEAWSNKSLEGQGRVRLLFAGRLLPEKGIPVLLDAAERIDAQGVALDLDIIGEGPEFEACRRCAALLRNVRVRMLSPVSYGAPFFELLRQYHAVVVPSTSDEQPRIVFDAYSQGVPLIASATDGLRPYLDHGQTGWLVTPGDSVALAAMLQRASESPDLLRSFGLQALAAAHRMTHQAMHRTRHRMLQECLGNACRKRTIDATSGACDSALSNQAQPV